MKMKKMVGALALTAALAMGTAPAFAAPGATGESAFDKTDKGSTDIKAEVQKSLDTQIQAKVPLQVVVTFGSTGASDILGPTADMYKITNTGEDAIAVENVEVTAPKSPFTSKAIYLDGSDWSTADGAITSGNYLMFTYKTAQNNTYLTPDHSLSLAKKVNDTAYAGPDAANFTKETIAKGGSLGIDFAGKAYFTQTISASDVSDTLCQVKYTIGAVS